MSYFVDYPKSKLTELPPQQTSELDELGYLEEEFGYSFEGETPVPETSFTMQSGGLTLNQLQARLGSLKAMIGQSDLSEEKKSALSREVQAIQNQINFTHCLSPERREAELSRLAMMIGPLEAKLVADGPEVSEEDSPEENVDAAGLKERHAELEKQLSKLESKGWITEELHEKLSAKLERISELLDDPDLVESAASLVEELGGNFDEIKELYAKEGEAVEAVGDIKAEEKVTWPFSDFVSKVPTAGDKYGYAVELATLINDAIRSDNWETVSTRLNTYKANYINDFIRRVITGIYLAAGSNDEKFRDLMEMIPAPVREAMKNRLTEQGGELGESHAGDQWNSAATAAMIEETLTESAAEEVEKDE